MRNSDVRFWKKTYSHVNWVLEYTRENFRYHLTSKVVYSPCTGCRFNLLFYEFRKIPLQHIISCSSDFQRARTLCGWTIVWFECFRKFVLFAILNFPKFKAIHESRLRQRQSELQRRLYFYRISLLLETNYWDATEQEVADDKRNPKWTPTTNIYTKYKNL